MKHLFCLEGYIVFILFKGCRGHEVCWDCKDWAWTFSNWHQVVFIFIAKPPGDKLPTSQVQDTSRRQQEEHEERPREINPCCLGCIWMILHSYTESYSPSSDSLWTTTSESEILCLRWNAWMVSTKYPLHHGISGASRGVRFDFFPQGVHVRSFKWKEVDVNSEEDERLYYCKRWT